MSNLKIGLHGQIEGFPQHDAKISCIRLGKASIEFRLTSNSGLDVDICFNHILRLVLNNLREGNIVDRFYICDLDGVSDFLLSKLNTLFTKEELAGAGIFVLSLDCSYGADFYALIKFDGDVNSYLKQLSFTVKQLATDPN